jgi:DNA/RNA-binding domain of Phe-tRNA-synthetase-like protein
VGMEDAMRAMRARVVSARAETHSRRSTHAAAHMPQHTCAAHTRSAHTQRTRTHHTQHAARTQRARLELLVEHSGDARERDEIRGVRADDEKVAHALDALLQRVQRHQHIPRRDDAQVVGVQDGAFVAERVHKCPLIPPG